WNSRMKWRASGSSIGKRGLGGRQSDINVRRRVRGPRPASKSEAWGFDILSGLDSSERQRRSETEPKVGAQSAYFGSRVRTRCQPQRGCVPSPRPTSCGRNQLTSNHHWSFGFHVILTPVKSSLHFGQSSFNRVSASTTVRATA